jgi:hypothetical protein
MDEARSMSGSNARRLGSAHHRETVKLVGSNEVAGARYMPVGWRSNAGKIGFVRVGSRSRSLSASRTRSQQNWRWTGSPQTGNVRLAAPAA